MKKCHQWEEAVNARCPHCHINGVYDAIGDEGDLMACHYCGKQFELGEQE